MPNFWPCARWTQTHVNLFLFDWMRSLSCIRAYSEYRGFGLVHAIVRLTRVHVVPRRSSFFELWTFREGLTVCVTTSPPFVPCGPSTAVLQSSPEADLASKKKEDLCDPLQHHVGSLHGLVHHQLKPKQHSLPWTTFPASHLHFPENYKHLR